MNKKEKNNYKIIPYLSIWLPIISFFLFFLFLFWKNTSAQSFSKTITTKRAYDFIECNQNYDCNKNKFLELNKNNKDFTETFIKTGVFTYEQKETYNDITSYDNKIKVYPTTDAYIVSDSK